MPTLRLLSIPTHADGSHRVGSPGGYEFWQFYAEDSIRRLRLMAAFHDGFALHPTYLQKYSAYIRRPTRNIPPLPSQYPCLQVSLFENTQTRGSWTTYFPANSFIADDHSISLAANRSTFGSGEITLTTSEPQYATFIELRFQSPQTESREIAFPPGSNGLSPNIWIPSRPLCEVEGRIRHRDRIIEFSGLGQHNHFYGTHPMPSAIGGWLRGCVLLPNSAEMFQIIGERAIAITSTGSNVLITENIHPTIAWTRQFPFGPAFPASIDFGERLILRNPRVHKPIARQLQIFYDAYVEGEQAVAMVEIDNR